MQKNPGEKCMRIKTWVKKIFGFGVASFFGDFSHEMTISFIPVLVTQFVGPAQAPLYLGIIASVSDAFASFIRIISGYLTDKFSQKKPLIILGYGVAAVFTTLVGFSSSLWQMFLYRALSFTGSGLREPPRDALIATIVEPADYGRAFGLRNAMDTLGSLIGPLIAFVCIGIFSMREIFALSFIPGILAVFAIVFLTKDMRVPKKNIRISRTFWKDFLLLPRTFILFLIILFIFDVSNFNKLLLISRTQEILTGDKDAIIKWLVLLYAFFNISRACSEFMIGFLSDYVNRIILLSVFGCGVFIAVAFMLMTPHASFIYCTAIFVLAGVSAAATSTLKKACAADMLPADIRGLGYGTLQASEGFAALFASAFIGFLWTNYSPMLGFSYVIVMSGIATILLLVFSFFNAA
jgi:MFS family permease